MQFLSVLLYSSLLLLLLLCYRQILYHHMYNFIDRIGFKAFSSSSSFFFYYYISYNFPMYPEVSSCVAFLFLYSVYSSFEFLSKCDYGFIYYLINIINKQRQIYSKQPQPLPPLRCPFSPLKPGTKFFSSFFFIERLQDSFFQFNKLYLIYFLCSFHFYDAHLIKFFFSSVQLQLNAIVLMLHFYIMKFIIKSFVYHDFD